MTDTTGAGGLRFFRAPRRLRQAGILVCWILGHVGSAQAALGTAFTYQGQLKELGLPASGVYDFEFKLFDAASAGAQVGPTVSAGDVAVSAGLFSLTLDFLARCSRVRRASSRSECGREPASAPTPCWARGRN